MYFLYVQIYTPINISLWALWKCKKKNFKVPDNFFNRKMESKITFSFNKICNDSTFLQTRKILHLFWISQAILMAYFIPRLYKFWTPNLRALKIFNTPLASLFLPKDFGIICPEISWKFVFFFGENLQFWNFFVYLGKKETHKLHPLGYDA